MGVKAKFFVQSVTEQVGQDGGGTVELAAVIRGENNKTWSKYTPSGKITMFVTNQAAFDWFRTAMRKGHDGQSQPEVFVTFEVSTED